MPKLKILICRACWIYPLAMLVWLLAFPAYGMDWKALTDEAIVLTPAAVSRLEGKQNKSEEDIYRLAMVYYRQYQYVALKKLFGDSEKIIPDSPTLKLIQGIILMRERRYGQSRLLLNGVLQKHPDFFPATFVLGHQFYLQKEYEQSYALARQLIGKNHELSRYHYTVSLLLAAGAKGIMTQKNLMQKIPAYFEVTGYFREAKKLMPRGAEVLYGLGCYHLLTPSVAGGDIDLAISLLEQSKRLTPLNPEVYVRLAQAYRAKQDESAYGKNIARAFEINPQDELLRDYLSGEKAFLDVP